jgi:glycine/D-amino acid oxidase-like deaminating enzyme
MTFDVAVIGAGCFGVWTAAKLKAEGASIALIDAFGAGHARSSSGGESRITRISYGGDPVYSAMAGASLTEWKRLSERADIPVFHPTGVLWFSPADDAYAKNSLAYLKRAGRSHTQFTTEDLRRAYPQMRFCDGESGFLERETGALIAGRGVQLVVASSDLKVRLCKASVPDRSSDSYEIAPHIRARTLVFACGPWLGKLFPELLGERFFVTRQEVLHFGCPPGDDRFAPPQLPVWADFNDGDLIYGFPDLEGQGFKIALDRHGPPIDPDTADRRVSPEIAEESRAYLARRFPDLSDAPLIHGRVCQYENTSNGDLLIDRHPSLKNVWLVGGGSGHGFKHGPEVGRIVAEHVMDPSRPIEPRFSLSTKARTQRRSIY